MLIEEEMEEAAAVQLEVPTTLAKDSETVLTAEPTETTPLPEIKRYCQERGIIPNGNKRYKSTWVAAVREFHRRNTVITTK
jgi:hypothetical protein